MAKDFSAINTGRVSQAIAQGTSKKGQQSTASPEEQAEREAAGRTQGRKGCHKKGVRTNLLLTPENHEFVKIMAGATGRNMTQYINFVIEEYQKAHPEYMEKAKEFLEFAGGEQ